MTGSKRPWFRFYNETLRDAKIRRASTMASVEPLVAIGAWAGLLCLASESTERGRCLVAGDLPFTVEEIAEQLHTTPDVLSSLIAAFARLGMVRWEDDCLVVVNWEKRQFESDSSTPRVQRFRERTEKRFCNVSVTHQNTETEYREQNTETDILTTSCARAREESHESAEPVEQIESAETLPIASPEERTICHELKAIKGYPYHFSQDLEFIRELLVDFPGLDILAEVRAWKTYLIDKPLKQSSRPHSQLRNWCRKAEQFAAERQARASPARGNGRRPPNQSQSRSISDADLAQYAKHLRDQQLAQIEGAHLP